MPRSPGLPAAELGSDCCTARTHKTANARCLCSGGERAQRTRRTVYANSAVAERGVLSPGAGWSQSGEPVALADDAECRR
ncbi:hypothetical protein EYF80_007147 [Liparis tanakae]|uniref:Uncharacterized protein n=1 Tax=Liparis tanakae TaxID=230148 RepID=A0A4Z2IXB1_9TELE|nr:hypothetical protein EYF80_007147 [Liparis tanakae]